MSGTYLITLARIQAPGSSLSSRTATCSPFFAATRTDQKKRTETRGHGYLGLIVRHDDAHFQELHQARCACGPPIAHDRAVKAIPQTNHHCIIIVSSDDTTGERFSSKKQDFFPPMSGVVYLRIAKSLNPIAQEHANFGKASSGYGIPRAADKRIRSNTESRATINGYLRGAFKHQHFDS